MAGTVTALYFSPTHGSRTIARTITDELAPRLDKQTRDVDVTLPRARNMPYSFQADDVLVLGFPVYGGRVPEPLENTLDMIRGNGATAVIAAVYGNRDYDDALLEAKDILTRNGFAVAAAGAFVGEHSFSRLVGANRPDAEDKAVAVDFARQSADKIIAGDATPPSVKGKTPYKECGPSAPAAPATSDACTDCKACARGCPMGVISLDNPGEVSDGCIKCCACVKVCPVGAKAFHDERMAAVTAMLESKCVARREPELFL